MIKLVAFDWNGTLIADTKLAVAGDNYAVKPYLRRKITLKLLQAHFQIPIIHYLMALGMDRQAYLNHSIEINGRFNKHYEARVSNCRTRAGVRVCLQYLAENNIKTVIYSNHVTNYIIKQLKRLKIEKYFDVVLAREDDDHSHLHSRGKAEKLKNFIKRHKLKPNEIISVGDSEEEIEIGKDGGYHTVAITGGYNSTSRLRKTHPDFLISNMLELKKIIKKLNYER